ncbi:MAG TPA: tryptophan 7-halogenase [Cytophagaceae bacterium]|jgi:flavin-dependent dehydrogenase|nr:tryptophan 7-halogenase [Cytophagaceae bacterium]
MTNKNKTIAIIGGGPAGGTIGTLLAQKGYKVGIFHTDKRPPLIVGESLLPAVIPMLQKLGIEEEVKSFSVYKPGATVWLGHDEVITSFFSWADGRLPDYAYNTQRDLFDLAVLNASERAGAKIFRTPAKLEKGDLPNTVRFTKETLDKTEGFFKEQPDLIIDASGRTRLLARLLDTPSRKGGRGDVALFAHLDKVFMTDPGNIHVDRHTKGWGWRIPLPGKFSCGIVLNPKYLEKYGDNIEAQYDGFIREEPGLKFFTEGATRLTPVVKYSNYQLISEKMYGPGWATVGDAAGFIDPIFSTGLYLSMKGAFELFKAIESDESNAMQKYEDGRHRELKMWQGVIQSWYNGRLFSLYRAGQKQKNNPIGAAIAPHVQKHLTRIFTGQAVDDVYSRKLFEYMTAFGIIMRNPKDLIVQ